MTESDNPVHGVRIVLATFGEAANFGRWRMNILGAFNSLNVTTFPHVLPQCVFVFRIHITGASSRVLPLRLVVIDPDGEPIFEEENETVHGDIPDTSLFSEDNMVPLNGITLPRAGEYRALIFVAGQQMCDAPLFAVSARAD